MPSNHEQAQISLGMISLHLSRPSSANSMFYCVIVGVSTAYIELIAPGYICFKIINLSVVNTKWMHQSDEETKKNILCSSIHVKTFMWAIKNYCSILMICIHSTFFTVWHLTHVQLCGKESGLDVNVEINFT